MDLPDVRVLVLVMSLPRLDVSRGRWAMVAVSDSLRGPDCVRVVGVDGSMFVEPACFVYGSDEGIERATGWADLCISVLGERLGVDPVVVVMSEPLLEGSGLSVWVEGAFSLAATVANCPRSRDDDGW